MKKRREKERGEREIGRWIEYKDREEKERKRKRKRKRKRERHERK